MKSMIPLSEKLRPKTLVDVFGQEHLMGENGWFFAACRAKKPLSILLWGPPGCGKTTLAKIYAQSLDQEITTISAVHHSITDVKKMILEREKSPLFRSSLLLFVDEIHRFNRAQQDAFLPFLENGTLTLIGATTENPSFALNSALLSRLRTLQLHPLKEEALAQILKRALNHLGNLTLTSEAQTLLLSFAAGDARSLLNMMETLSAFHSGETITEELLPKIVQRRPAMHDKDREGHYNLISALHKSVRGSDPNAALYWLYRLINGGESPDFIARRLVRMASEDIGLADPQALQITLNAWDVFKKLGSPEGELALAEATVYLALAPKSNALYLASKAAEESAQKTSHLSPPAHILNAPTKFMKELGYGKEYAYDHDTPEGCSGQNYFPPEMPPEKFYTPIERGFERELKKRLDYFQKIRAGKR